MLAIRRDRIDGAPGKARDVRQAPAYCTRAWRLSRHSSSSRPGRCLVFAAAGTLADGHYTAATPPSSSPPPVKILRWCRNYAAAGQWSAVPGGTVTAVEGPG